MRGPLLSQPSAGSKVLQLYLSQAPCIPNAFLSQLWGPFPCTHTKLGLIQDPRVTLVKSSSELGTRGRQTGGWGWGGRPPGLAVGPGLSGLFVQIWKVFLSPFESRRPWPKRFAFQILQQHCQASPYPLSFLCSSQPLPTPSLHQDSRGHTAALQECVGTLCFPRNCCRHLLSSCYVQTGNP